MRSQTILSPLCVMLAACAGGSGGCGAYCSSGPALPLPTPVAFTSWSAVAPGSTVKASGFSQQQTYSAKVTFVPGFLGFKDPYDTVIGVQTVTPFTSGASYTAMRGEVYTYLAGETFVSASGTPAQVIVLIPFPMAGTTSRSAFGARDMERGPVSWA
jgi:hypothetical protein